MFSYLLRKYSEILFEIRIHLLIFHRFFFQFPNIKVAVLIFWVSKFNFKLAINIIIILFFLFYFIHHSFIKEQKLFDIQIYTNSSCLYMVVVAVNLIN